MPLGKRVEKVEGAMLPTLILILATLLALFPTTKTAALDANPPLDAKEVPCVGSATRKVCIGSTERTLYEVMGKQQEVRAWTDEARDEEVKIFEVNQGTAGCWIRLARSTARVARIQCAEIEK